MKYLTCDWKKGESIVKFVAFLDSLRSTLKDLHHEISDDKMVSKLLDDLHLNSDNDFKGVLQSYRRIQKEEGVLAKMIQDLKDAEIMKNRLMRSDKVL